MGKQQRKKKTKPSKQKTRYSIQKDPGKLIVAACLMVKNEQANIERCLRSLKSRVDRIYVLDTGSTDKTPEICESWGCIVNYFDDPGAYMVDTKWGPMLNFSKARNKALSFVEADWVLSIDADEEFVWNMTTREMFYAYLANLPKQVAGINVDMNDLQRDGRAMLMTVAKIFRVGRVHYKHIVHNKAIADGKAVILEGVYINHYGYDLYDDPEKKRKKFERTAGLLLERVKADPNDWEAWFYLSQQYIIGGEIEEGLKACAKYVSFMDQAKRKRNFNPTVFYSAAKTLIDRGRFDEASDWIRKGLINNDKDMDLSYALMLLGVGTKKVGLTIKGGEQYLACYNEFSKNSRFNYGKFNLTYNPVLLCNALNALALARIEFGVQTLVDLDRTMLQIPEERRHSIYHGLIRDLGQGKLAHLVKVMSVDKIVKQPLQ